jgi:hypothetical protein
MRVRRIYDAKVIYIQLGMIKRAGKKSIAASTIEREREFNHVKASG